MHDIVADEFERHLNGDASLPSREHLNSCSVCKAELDELARISHAIRELSGVASAPPQPSGAFYAKVAARIVEDQRERAWGFLSPGAIFFRRIAFASLLLLAGLGGFLVVRESSPLDPGSDAAGIIAAHDSAAHPESADRDRLLLTLATYSE